MIMIIIIKQDEQKNTRNERELANKYPINKMKQRVRMKKLKENVHT